MVHLHNALLFPIGWTTFREITLGDVLTTFREIVDTPFRITLGDVGFPEMMDI